MHQVAGGRRHEGRPVEFGPEGLREMLELWLDAGAELGNHSYAHLNINSVPLAQFTADITRGEPVLEAEGYILAPVTLDNSDYMYAALYTKPEYRERVRRDSRERAERGSHARAARDVSPPRLRVRPGDLAPIDSALPRLR